MALRLQNVRPWGGALTDLGIDAGVLVDAATLPASTPTLDGLGGIALPTLTNAHVHTDKTAWGEPWLSRPTMTELADFVGFDVASRGQLARSVHERTYRLLADAVAAGTRAVRTHVDVAPVYGLDNVTATARVAAQLAAALDVQIVAFPQLGVARAPGTAQLLAESVDAGAHLVGGIDPWSFDDAPDAQLDLLFGIAHDRGVDVDIHLHDEGVAGLEMLEHIARRVEAAGLVGRVTVSHAFCLGDTPADRLAPTIELLAQADVALTTCAYGEVPMLPLRELETAGVRVGLGTDGIRDAWSPFGSPDMLDRVAIAAYQLGAASDDELTYPLRLAANAGAWLLGLPDVTLAPGDPADLMVVHGECVAQVVLDRPPRSLVLKAGNVVAQSGALV